MIKLKHKDGLFGTPEVTKHQFYDQYSFFDDDVPYHLEYTKSPFSLISIDIKGTIMDISETYSSDIVESLIKDGVWEEFE